MAFYAYILKCSDGSYYAGRTDNLEAHLEAYNRGQVLGHTFSRRPVSLVFSDRFPTREETFERERQIKGWSKAKKEALIEGNWDRLVQLSRKKADSLKQDGRPSTSSG